MTTVFCVSYDILIMTRQLKHPPTISGVFNRCVGGVRRAARKGETTAVTLNYVSTPGLVTSCVFRSNSLNRSYSWTWRKIPANVETYMNILPLSWLVYEKHSVVELSTSRNWFRKETLRGDRYLVPRWENFSSQNVTNILKTYSKFQSPALGKEGNCELETRTSIQPNERTVYEWENKNHFNLRK